MSDSPYGVTPGGTWPPPGPPAGPPPVWPPVAPKQSRAPIVISLVVAVIAVAIAIGSWFRPAETPAPVDTTPHFSDQEVADAKKAVCDAHDLVNRASTSAANQKSEDPTLTFIIAVNVRLEGALAGSYLLAKVDQNPATPPKLADAARKLALAYQDTTLLQLSDASKDELNTIYDTLNSTDAKVVEACK